MPLSMKIYRFIRGNLLLFLMKLGQYYVYCRGKRIAERIYDKKYLKNRYFYKKDKKYLAAGWIWTMNDYKARKSRTMNAGVAFPVSPYNTVWGYENIFFDPSDLLLFQGSGKYFQASNGGRIYIGKGTYIANNTAIITSNHDVHDPDLHTEGKDVVIGKKCWIAFNAVLLPGVVLGDHTTVGAGAVVTRSFPEGNCVIAGNPARLIRKIDPSADNQSIR